MKWCSNTRYWFSDGDLEARVEFSGGVWSWMIVDADEVMVAGGQCASAAAGKRAAEKALKGQPREKAT